MGFSGRADPGRPDHLMGGHLKPRRPRSCDYDLAEGYARAMAQWYLGLPVTGSWNDALHTALDARAEPDCPSCKGHGYTSSAYDLPADREPCQTCRPWASARALYPALPTASELLAKQRRLMMPSEVLEQRRQQARNEATYKAAMNRARRTPADITDEEVEQAIESARFAFMAQPHLSGLGEFEDEVWLALNRCVCEVPGVDTLTGSVSMHLSPFPAPERPEPDPPRAWVGPDWCRVAGILALASWIGAIWLHVLPLMFVATVLFGVYAIGTALTRQTRTTPPEQLPHRAYDSLPTMTERR